MIIDINGQFIKRSPRLAKLAISPKNHCRSSLFPEAEEDKEDHV